MTRWRLSVRDDSGRARVTLWDGSNAVGVINMSWADYKSAMLELVKSAMAQLNSILETHLGELVWRDAQTAAGNSTDEAMSRLASIGWTADTVRRAAKELTQHVAVKLLGRLP